MIRRPGAGRIPRPIVGMDYLGQIDFAVRQGTFGPI